MGLFGSGAKKENKDRDELLCLMQTIIDSEDFKTIDTSAIEDRELADKFEAMMNAVVLSNNKTVMNLNQAMRRIGDSSSVKEMIETVNEQTEEIDLLRDNSTTLGTSIENVVKLMQDIQDGAIAVSDASNKSASELNSSVELIDESTNMAEGVAQDLSSFKDKAAMIGDIINDIKKLAGKSGMLALNASIEAARAGEAGKGFAVVAEQVRDLSANTKASAENIETYMSELLELLDALNATISNTTDKMKQGNESIHQSISSINGVGESIGDITSKINIIYDEINTQSALTENFLAATDSLAESYHHLTDRCVDTGVHMHKISREIDKLRSDLARGNSEITKLDWITVYEIDHLIFTWRIYNNVSGFEKLKIEQVNNNTGCKFGKWVTANESTPLGKTSEFKAAKDAHNRLHSCAVASWEAMNSNDRVTAMNHFEEAYREYDNFVKAINGLRKAVRALGDVKETKI